MLNNAAEAYADATGSINVDLKVINCSIFLSISDNGKGMPAEVLQKLRDGVEVTHGKEQGRGIGSMQIRDAIKNLNGTLHIDSTLGAGSEFRVRFPLEQ